jgi:peptidoglycan hydrolase CwlO-like protein
MRKPALFALLAVIVLLIAATALLFSKYKATTASYTDAETRYSGAINAIAEIQDSLNAIVVGDTTVQMLSQTLQGEQHLTEPQSRQVLDRISIVNASIERTKARINDLEEKLKKSGVRIGGLQKMIAGLKRDVSAKEDLVSQLTVRVDSLQTTVSGLQTEVRASQDTILAKDQSLEEKRRELATIYYIVGTRKELLDSGVLVAKGGVLGLGKTLQLSGHYNENLFTPLDTDQEHTITASAARARVLSPQPLSSYELAPAGLKTELHILDAREFRKVKHLVIMTG